MNSCTSYFGVHQGARILTIHYLLRYQLKYTGHTWPYHPIQFSPIPWTQKHHATVNSTCYVGFWFSFRLVISVNILALHPPSFSLPYIFLLKRSKFLVVDSPARLIHWMSLREDLQEARVFTIKYMGFSYVFLQGFPIQTGWWGARWSFWPWRLEFWMPSVVSSQASWDRWGPQEIRRAIGRWQWQWPRLINFWMVLLEVFVESWC